MMDEYHINDPNIIVDDNDPNIADYDMLDNKPTTSDAENADEENNEQECYETEMYDLLSSIDN